MKAWATLLTKAAYLPGVLVVYQSLQDVATEYPFIVMVTPDLPTDIRSVLKRYGVNTREIQSLRPKNASAALDTRFIETWTKLRAFELFEYERVVLLDADMIVKRNMDELMTTPLKEGWIACTHACACNPRKIAHYPKDWTPENCAYNCPEQPAPMSDTSPRPYGLLNSGLIVIQPSKEQNETIHQFLFESPLVKDLQFPDQDLLAIVYAGKWKRLMWYYNALKTLRIIHPNLWKSDDDVRCLHYILADKPWSRRPGPDTKGSDYDEVNRWWWAIYDRMGESMSQSEIAKKDWVLLQACLPK